MCSKLQGLQFCYPENFRCHLTHCKSENISNSSLSIIFLNPKNFSGIYKVALKIVHEWNVYIEIFSCPLE